jgi:ATP-binding cassette subfamily C protein
MKLHLFLFRDLVNRLGWRFVVLVLGTAVVGLTEGASVALLLPLLSRIGVVTANGQGVAVQMLDKALNLIGATGPWQILAVIVAVAGTQTALFIVLNAWTAALARRYQGERQLEMFGAFMRAKWGFIVDRKAGDLTNAIVTESERLGRAFTIALSLLASAVVTVIYIVLSLLIAWPITLSLVALALLTALAMKRLYRKSYAVGQSLAPLDAELQSVLEEFFANAKFIKASAGGERAAARVEPVVHKLEKANAFASALPGTVRGLLEFVAFICVAVVLVLGSTGMDVAGGNIVVVLALFARLFPRLTAVQAQVHYLNGNVHAIEAIDALQSAAEAQAERLDTSVAPLSVALPARLTVRDLTVMFGERKALDRVDVDMALPGMLAIVGGSGAGKSTLVHTLLGLVEPSAGSVRLGSHELATAPLAAWRRAIGYVPQETSLFHASVWDNITLANPGASRADVERAVRRAHAQEFIAAMPQGYDTVIGDQGVKLSGGQRQRLGIARALVGNPVLLVLDEAMSALDAASESEVLKTLEELRGQMGILIVAHRLAAVRTADRICVFEQGRVVETGTWPELMARRARLYALASAQALDHDRQVEAL